MPLWSSPTVPAPQDVDVVACSAIDCVTDGIILSFIFHIPGPPLDIYRLRTALFDVVRTKMPRAGCRLARRNGLLEFHIPKAFSAEEPPIGFTSVHHDAPYPRDKLQFPPALPNGLKAQPCALPNLPPTKEMLPVFVDPRTPTVMKDYFVPNTPAVHAHVSTFDDATVISLTIPHAVVDIQGVAILMRAWTAALNGELESVQHSPSTYAPFDTLAAAPDVPSSSSDNPWRGWFFLSIFSIIRWVIAFLWKNYSEGSGSVYNMWFPKEWLAQRKEECMAELKARGSDEWVGTNDVLMAAYYKAMHTGRRDDTPIHLFSALNLRRVLPGDFATYPYFNNGITNCSALPIPASQLGSQSILETALALRRSINTMTADLPTLRSEMAWLGRTYRGKPAQCFPCPPGCEFMVTSNWRSAELGELDFSAARTTKWDSPAKPFASAILHEGGGLPMRGGFSIGAESDEGVWVSGVLGESVWKRVRDSGLFAFV